GEFRGGLGVELRFRALCPIRINIHTERTQCAPWGLHGGLPALANRVIIERADGRREMRRNGKLDAEPLAENDVLITESGGGGGFGDPRGRDRAAVRADIRNGYVSIEAAARDYGLT
ncbi:MAG TPA: hydantoinase B/oxoprolinase family protein, partial [Candidatus Aquilonibacter sp.]